MSIYDALKKRYKAPEFGILFEVANRTGWGRYQYADAMAMSLWPSRGLVLHGIEIKLARGDWLRELRQPAKSAEIQTYCNFWWVAAPKGIVKLDEVPATWGLLELHGEKTLRCKKQAPDLTPVDLDRTFLAAIFRRLSEAQTQWIAKGSIQEELDKARQEGRDDQPRELQRAKSNLADLARDVQEFEKAAGVKIGRWDAGDVGRRMRIAKDVDTLTSSIQHVLNLRRTVQGVLKQIDALTTLANEENIA